MRRQIQYLQKFEYCDDRIKNTFSTEILFNRNTVTTKLLRKQSWQKTLTWIQQKDCETLHNDIRHNSVLCRSESCGEFMSGEYLIV